MKILFAVNNEHISESIIKKYQQDYKELISSKNVYYFNALIKEIQQDKTYDRIVIGEDLEMFSNNNYDVMDKFIFDKLDKVSDEATNTSGEDIPIILICTDRRNKSDAILVKLFSIGIYSALLGQDRTITNVCKLINMPRNKKEAKVYYRIESDEAGYKSENENDVSEMEIQNILMHYKRLGKNEEKYVDSFNNIASQYTDEQLKVIVKFLPLNIKAVLESECTKYQEIMLGGVKTISQKPSNKTNNYSGKSKEQVQAPKFNDAKLDMIQKQLDQNRLTKPVIVPNAMNIKEVKKIEQNEITQDDGFKQVNFNNQNINKPVEMPQENNIIENTQASNNIIDEEDPLADIKAELEGIINSENTENESPIVAQPKRRGRPKKTPEPTIAVLPGLDIDDVQDANSNESPKRRGRPRKVQVAPVEEIEKTSIQDNETNDQEDKYKDIVPSSNNPNTVNLFDLDEEENNINITNTTQSTTPIAPIIEDVLPGLEEEEPINNTTQDNNNLPNYNNQQVDNNLSGYNNQQANNNLSGYNQQTNNNQNNNLQNAQNSDVDVSRLISANSKIVSFVGTSKNGTSFLVNNLAEMLSQNGIKTAILDLTQNKNAYYIYTENEEELRKVAFACIDNLRRGNAQGIKVNKNLDVYTTLPGESKDIEDVQNIMQTLVNNYSLILLDCDFNTNVQYFKVAQEMYLVQSYDILTIQALTAFLRELKTKNILQPEKLKVVLNKVLRVKSITDKTIIGGMAYYNDPAMSFMTELFNKDSIPYCTIPFEDQTYSKYLEGLVNCKITTNGYSKNFIAALTQLSNMVYPLVSKGNIRPTKQNYNGYESNNTFNSNVNDTLNKMKNF